MTKIQLETIIKFINENHYSASDYYRLFDKVCVIEKKGFIQNSILKKIILEDNSIEKKAVQFLLTELLSYQLNMTISNKTHLKLKMEVDTEARLIYLICKNLLTDQEISRSKHNLGRMDISGSYEYWLIMIERLPLSEQRFSGKYVPFLIEPILMEETEHD